MTATSMAPAGLARPPPTVPTVAGGTSRNAESRSKIVGYGSFARYEPTREWLAWDAFGDLNGAASFDEMAGRLLARRKRTRSAADERPED